MKQCIEPVMFILDRAKKAMKAVGIEPREVPIRGGTDGARLSYMGLPCPNLCTGGENFHGRFEYILSSGRERHVADILRACGDIRIAYINIGLVYGDDFVYLIGNILHAVSAESILSTHCPTGACHILSGITVIGRVKNYAAFGLTFIGHAQQSTPQGCIIFDEDFTVFPPFFLNRGLVILNHHIFVIKGITAAEQHSTAQAE
jgi:hypothetical protein